MRAFARLMGLPIISGAFAAFEHAVRTGSPALEAVDPKGFWHYLHDHLDEAAVFEQAMIAKAHADVAAVLDVYDFARHRRIADIAGGHGHLIRAVLAAHPETTGVLFELPAVATSGTTRTPRTPTRSSPAWASASGSSSGSIPQARSPGTSARSREHKNAS
jgi:hypothetical protein